MIFHFFELKLLFLSKKFNFLSMNSSLQCTSSEDLSMICSYLKTCMKCFSKDYFLRRCFKIHSTSFDSSYIQSSLSQSHPIHHFPSFLGTSLSHLQLLDSSFSSPSHVSPQTDISTSVRDALSLELHSRSKQVSSRLTSLSLSTHTSSIDTLYLFMGVQLFDKDHPTSVFLPKFLIELETKDQVVLKLEKLENTNHIQASIEIQSC